MFYLTGFVKSLEFWKNGKKSCNFFQSFNRHLIFIGEFFLFWSNLIPSHLYMCTFAAHDACLPFLRSRSYWSTIWKNKLLLRKHVWKKSWPLDSKICKNLVSMSRNYKKSNLKMFVVNHIAFKLCNCMTITLLTDDWIILLKRLPKKLRTPLHHTVLKNIFRWEKTC